jgi:hypothetical protein
MPLVSLDVVVLRAALVVPLAVVAVALLAVVYQIRSGAWIRLK